MLFVLSNIFLFAGPSLFVILRAGFASNAHSASMTVKSEQQPSGNNNSHSAEPIVKLETKTGDGNANSSGGQHGSAPHYAPVSNPAISASGTLLPPIASPARVQHSSNSGSNKNKNSPSSSAQSHSKPRSHSAKPDSTTRQKPPRRGQRAIKPSQKFKQGEVTETYDITAVAKRVDETPPPQQ